MYLLGSTSEHDQSRSYALINYKLTDLGKFLVEKIKKATPPSLSRFEGTRLKDTLRSTVSDKLERRLIHYYSRQALRDNMREALFSSKELPLGYKNGTYQSLIGYNQILECHCTDIFSRSHNNVREKLEEKILSIALELKSKKMKPHIAVIGSGRLLQEIQLLNTLKKSGIRNLKIDFIDLIYKDTTSWDMVDPFETKEDMKSIVRQFCTLVDDGLGFRVVPGNKTPESCKYMNGFLKQFSEKESSAHYHPAKDKLEVTFFGSSEEYLKASESSENCKPNIVYDIDVYDITYAFNFNDRADIIDPVLEATDTDAYAISVYSNQLLRGSDEDVTLECLPKIGGNWEPSQSEHLLYI